MAIWEPEEDGRRRSPSRAPGTPTWRGCSSTAPTTCGRILERASARETAARVAAGGVAKALLRRFGTEIRSHVVRIGAGGRRRCATT